MLNNQDRFYFNLLKSNISLLVFKMQDHKTPKIPNSHSFNQIRNNEELRPIDPSNQDNANIDDEMRNTWKREQPKINANKLPSAFTQSNNRKY